jgi:mono/diheme cytochrome c family protein/glucose/arabinose dehydrogenase
MITLTRLTVGLVSLLLSTTLHAQKGDKGDKNQPLRVPREKIPPAPPLSPEQALKTFKVAPGFRIELVASEPLVEAPVAMAFDPDGRIWVVEMRGFMPNVDGRGETEIPGRVVILEDSDNDGRIDKRTVFLDGLMMPRAITLIRGGALVAEPPHLWFCRDTDGDGKCDQKIEVASDYGDPRNPEHTANGLLLARNNWIYSLYHAYRYRYLHEHWTREPDPNRAQWGLAQDDFGRLFYTANSDQLRGDLVPTHYLKGRPPGTKVPGFGAKIATDQTVWPSRVNPGVNRGYQPNTLRPDGTLARFTAACGTSIYRGDVFPAEFYGNAFVCEPAANLVHRNVLKEKDGVVTAASAYNKSEFLTSTDERFRPVNSYTGPDGALYIVDMYRGILQHRVYVTTYLRKQIEERGLDKPLDQGRIYRVVPDNKAPSAKPKLSTASSAELIGHLSHPNGWRRDTAQRLLVERNDASTVPDLKKLVQSSPNPLARLHALWTLEGVDQCDPATISIALADRESKIRAAAVRIAEPFLSSSRDVVSLSPTAGEGQGEGAVLRTNQIFTLTSDPSADVQIQLALLLSQLAPNAAARHVLSNIVQQTPFALARDCAKFALGAFEPPKIVAVKMAKLSAEDQKRFDAGKLVYEATCVACHQGHGLGQEGLAPPLAGSEWVGGSPERMIRIVLNGLRGPIRVKKQVFELDMPSLGVLDDEQIASVVTYVRKEWGHSFSSVDATDVKRIRDATAKHDDAWTEAELKKVR